MTVKNRNKSNSQPIAEKIPAVKQQDDVAKKSPKNAPVVAGPSAFMKFIYAIFYLTLAGGAGLAAFYLQQVLSEVRVTTLRNEESMERCRELSSDVEHALQQINSLKSSLEGLETAVVDAKADLQGTSRAVQKGEDKNRQMEETLQNLQNKIFRDLTNGIEEVKDAREKDVSSLERTLEERLSQLSRSISESVAEFAGEQNQYKSELQELKARLEEQHTPAFLKQELTAINSAVANLNTANEVAEGNVEVLREQIATVGAELQTRNKEVASVSEEIEAVRSLMQSTVGALREEVSAARAGVQGTSDQLQALTDGQDRSSEAIQTLEKQLREELLKVEKRGEDVEARLKATEESEELLTSSLSEQTIRLDVFISKYESHESSLNEYKTSAVKDIVTLRDDLEEMKSSLGEIQVSIAALDETQVRLQAVEQKLDGLKDAEGSEEPQELESTAESPSEDQDESE